MTYSYAKAKVIDMESNKYNPQEDVDYAIQVGLSYLDLLKRVNLQTKGLRILELGPGKNDGGMLILTCLGAECAVSDKYLADWDDNTHPIFYSALSKAIKERIPDANVKPIEKLVRINSYTRSVMWRAQSAAEDLSVFPSNYFDVVFSNAVLEHVVDPRLSTSEIYRITKPRGWSIHQIDYRDHRDFDQPLEYLFMESNDFAEMFKERNGECGNRYRSSEFVNFFKKAGFSINRVEHNKFSELDYLASMKERLTSHNMNYTEEDISVLSGRIYATKPHNSGKQSSNLFTRIKDVIFSGR